MIVATVADMIVDVLIAGRAMLATFVTLTKVKRDDRN